MMRTVMFTFDDENSVGVFDLPVESLINIKDSSGKQMMIFFLHKTGLTASSTIADVLANQSLYKEVSKGYEHIYDVKINSLHVSL